MGAKSSTMNLLYLMHNPSLPAYLYCCNMCGEEIATGHRYHCRTCPDFDLCEMCYREMKYKRTPHQHPLEAISANNGTVPHAMKVIQAERKKVIGRFLAALVHAEKCKGCDLDECIKVKQFLYHRYKCKVRASGGCQICKRVLVLLQMHASECTKDDCRLLHCKDLKARERMRQGLLKAQQQQQQRQQQQQQLSGVKPSAERKKDERREKSKDN